MRRFWCVLVIWGLALNSLALTASLAAPLAAKSGLFSAAGGDGFGPALLALGSGVVLSSLSVVPVALVFWLGGKGLENLFGLRSSGPVWRVLAVAGFALCCAGAVAIQAVPAGNGLGLWLLKTVLALAGAGACSALVLSLSHRWWGAAAGFRRLRSAGALVLLSLLPALFAGRLIAFLV